MGKKKEVTIGYKYFLGVHFVLMHGQADALTHITVDERLAWAGSNAGGNLFISNENLFGGEKREGGIMGTVSFMPGSPTQTQNPYLAAKLGADTPAYRRVASAVLNQTYLGTNPYLKKWAFRLRRILKKSDGTDQWYTAKAAIGQDMNPAHIIRECLTDRDWGMGYLSSDINEASFVQAADTLYNESFGLSILWDKQSSIEDFVKQILAHIDGSLYVDKSTGLFTLFLVRDGYNANTLKVFDEENIVAVEDYSATTFTELSNSVTVNYWDASTGKNNSMTVQDIALVQIQGSTISHTVEYGGVTNGALASRLAARDLRALSTPIVKCNVITNRDGAKVTPGEPIKLNWPDYGVSNLIMRVAAIDYGTATDNTVKLALVQDVFALSTATYAPPSATEWLPVTNEPVAATNRVLIEAPYYTLVRQFGETEVNERMATLPDIGVILTAASRPTPDSLNATVWVDSGAGYDDETTLDFSPYAVCSGVVSQTATSVALSTTSDFYVDMITVGDYGLINSEIVGITSFSETTVGLKRGCLDTVPVQHAAGSKLYILSTYNGVGANEYVVGETVSVKLTPVTGKGTLLLSAAPSSSVTMNRRALRPYPPGNFKIGGVSYPSVLLADEGSVPITWAHRSRTQQTGATLVSQSDGSIGPEAGTTYNLRVYNADTSAVLINSTGLTGTSLTPTLPTGGFNARVELESVRGGLTSLQKHTCTFYYMRFNGNLVTEDGDQFVTEDNLDSFILE
jgi:hypothetical protein